MIARTVQNLTAFIVQNQIDIDNFTLNPFSVLFGMNDSGKTNLLLALSLALGKRVVTEKDVFCSQEVPYDTLRSIIIDLKFIPVDINGKQVESFDGVWGLHFGSNVQTDENDKEYFAFRTKFTFDVDKGDYARERLLITTWAEGSITEGSAIGNKTLAAFEYIYLDAHRDISQDIREKSSMWSRQVSKIKINCKTKTEIEDSLNL